MGTKITTRKIEIPAYIRREGRNANTEVDIHAILELQRGTAHNSLANSSIFVDFSGLGCRGARRLSQSESLQAAEAATKTMHAAQLSDDATCQEIEANGNLKIDPYSARYLDALFRVRLENGMNVNAGQVNRVGREAAFGHHFFDLSLV